MEHLGILALRILTISATCSVVLAPLLLLAPRIQKRVAAKSFYVLFLLLAVRLLVPVELTLSEPVVTVEAPVYEVTVPSVVTIPERRASYSYADDGSTQREIADSEPVTHPAERTVSVQELLGLVWAVGTAACLGYGIFSYAMARRRLIHHSRTEDGPALDCLARLREELRIRRPVALRRSDGQEGPLMLGLVNPVIVLPGRLLLPDELEFILRHELTHLRRWDVAYKGILSLACAVHWFNPLVWLMSRAAGRNLELCCDDAVVRDMPPALRHRYGTVLLNAAETARPLALSTRFSGGKNQLKGRLANLFLQKKNSTALVCVGVGAALLLGSLVACESGGGSPAESADNQARRAQYETYFNEHFQTEYCSVLLVDLTGDGQSEMVVLDMDSERNGEKLSMRETITAEDFVFCGLQVYGIVDGAVTEFYDASIAKAHAGFGYYYLYPGMNSSVRLLYFNPYVGGGFGEYQYQLFHFNETGTVVEDDSATVSFLMDDAMMLAGDKTDNAWQDEVEAFLTQVETYRTQSTPLLIYYEGVGGTNAGPDFRYWNADPALVFAGEETGAACGEENEVPFYVPEAGPSTPEEAIDLLEKSLTEDGNSFVFRVPSYDGDWSIQISGRMRTEGENFMSVHYLEGTDWTPGIRYICEVTDGYYDTLTMFVSVTAPDGTAAEREIPLLTAEYPAGSTSTGQETSPETKLQTITLYVPEDSARSLRAVEIELEVSPQGILDALIAQGALLEGVQVNSFTEQGGMLYLDLNDVYSAAFSEASMEEKRMLIVSVVDSFLNAYNVSAKIMITCDGVALDLGDLYPGNRELSFLPTGDLGPDYDVNWRLLTNFISGFASAYFSKDDERAADYMAEFAEAHFEGEPIADRIQEYALSWSYDGDVITAVCEYQMEGRDTPGKLTMILEDQWASGAGEGYVVLSFEGTD